MLKPGPLLAAVLTAAALLAPATTHAGVYSDSLARCLVERTTDDDKVLLARWIFTVISAHPSAATLATIDETQKVATARGTGELFETLLTGSCREETMKAVRYEGTQALNASFKVLGEIAMNTLMTDPAVQAESANFMPYVDEEKLGAVFAPQDGD